jgi:hypothetical protein
MRKGSKKPICIVPNPAEITDPIDLEQMSSGKTITELQMGRIEVVKNPLAHAGPFVTVPDYRILGILLRLCDACHEMDTRTEPWASIRKDIEGLK